MKYYETLLQNYVGWLTEQFYF